MNQIKAFTIIMCILFLLISLSHAQVPGQINYQGQLTDNLGNSVSDGHYNMEFALYDTDTGGTALWREPQSVLVADGIYNVVLGQPGNELSANLFSSDLYLGVKVDEDDEMTPRQALTSVPFAMKAGSTSAGAVTEIMLANDAVTTDKVAAGAISADKIDGGSGSGVDADRLDGLDATAFATAAGVAALQLEVDTEEEVRETTDINLLQQINGLNDRLNNPDKNLPGTHGFIGEIILGDQYRPISVYELTLEVSTSISISNPTEGSIAVSNLNMLIPDGPHVPQLSFQSAGGSLIRDVLVTIVTADSDVLTVNLPTVAIVEVSIAPQINTSYPRLIQVSLNFDAIILSFKGQIAGFSRIKNIASGLSSLSNTIRFYETFGTIPKEPPGGMPEPVTSFGTSMNNSTNLGLGGGGGGGKSSFAVQAEGDILDTAVSFFFDLVSHRFFDEVSLEKFGPYSDTTPESKILLGDAAIIYFGLSTSSTGRLLQKLAFYSNTITWIDNEIDNDGTVTTVSRGWDIARNSPL
ncbi:MAG: hypothetical protein QNK40_11505 [Desulfobacterales bacterium]|nr:hypothetical protein [Desulfobacterales bacterium]